MWSSLKGAPIHALLPSRRKSAYPQSIFSVQHRFLSGISATLDGIEKVAAQQYPMLCTPPLSDDFTNFKKTAELRAAAAIKYQSVLLLKPSLTKEFSYSRWSGTDCKVIEEHVRRLLLRAGAFRMIL